MLPRMPASAVLVAGVACALAAPAAAQAAPTLQPLEPCYVSAGTDAARSRCGSPRPASRRTRSSPSPIDGVRVPGGGAPGRPERRVRGASRRRTSAGGERARFTVTLTETGNPANAARRPRGSRALTVEVSPKQAAPTQRVRFSGRGSPAPARSTRTTCSATSCARRCAMGAAQRRLRHLPGAPGRQIPVKSRGPGPGCCSSTRASSTTDAGRVFVQLLIRVRARAGPGQTAAGSAAPAACAEASARRRPRRRPRGRRPRTRPAAARARGGRRGASGSPA